MTSSGNEKNGCVILYSGGTDSTCTASLMAEKFPAVHLLTFYQARKKTVSGISGTILSLKNKFPGVAFFHNIIPVTRLVKFISYDRYPRYALRHSWLVLSLPGFTALSWHIAAIVYCRSKGIRTVADGLTRELMHFPGHMDGVIAVFRGLYAAFGIKYINPVREWETPPDRQFIDRLIVDQHGYLFPREGTPVSGKRTTSRYLYELGVMPRPDVKGSPADKRMQYDCYPFVLYNIMVFWIYLNFHSYEYLCGKMRLLFEEKTRDLQRLLAEYLETKKENRLSKTLQS